MAKNTAPSALSIPHRVALFRVGLLTEADAKDLISDALASNMTHYLPAELFELGREMFRRGELKTHES